MLYLINIIVDMKDNVEIENKIYTALNSDQSLWHNINEVASATGITSNDIFKAINESNKFVLSSDKEQQPVITTRERFRNEESFFTKLIGAFKNRIT